MSRTIPLTKGLLAIVDDEDYERLIGLGKWQAKGGPSSMYAVRNRWTSEGVCITDRMHRLLVPGAQIVDHINGDGLDNRKANLRSASQVENARNRRVRIDAETAFKGVKRTGRQSNPWRAVIRHGGAQIHLGVFPTVEDAARAYDAAARTHHGEFARLNFPKEIAS